MSSVLPRDPQYSYDLIRSSQFKQAKLIREVHYIHSETAAKQVSKEKKLDIVWKEGDMREEERENVYNIRERREKKGPKRKDSDKGSVCVYHTGVSAGTGS